MASLRAIAWAVLVGSAAACTFADQLPEDLEAGVRFPVWLNALPGGRYVAVWGANFDRKYRAGKMRLLDTQTERYVGNSMEFSGFAGSAALQMPTDPSAASKPLRAIVTSRETDDLSIGDFVDSDPPSFECGGVDNHGYCLRRYPLATATDDNNKAGADPMGIEIVAVADGEWRVNVVAAADGRLTSYRLNQKGQMQPIGHAVFGAGPTAVLTVPATGRSYVSDARAPALHVFQVSADPAATVGYRLEVQAAIALPGASVRDYSRGLALSTDGARLYVADRSPAALLIVDVSADALGVPRNQVAGLITLGGQPSEVAVAPAGPNGGEQVFVSAFNDDAIFVVDAVQRRVLRRIALPHAPYALAAVQRQPAAGAPAEWTLYAALFNRHALAAIPISAGATGQYEPRLVTGVP